MIHILWVWNTAHFCAKKKSFESFALQHPDVGTNRWSLLSCQYYLLAGIVSRNRMFTHSKGWAEYRNIALLNPVIFSWRRPVYADVSHSDSVLQTTKWCGNLECAITLIVADVIFIVCHLCPCAVTSAAIVKAESKILNPRDSIAILLHVNFFMCHVLC